MRRAATAILIACAAVTLLKVSDAGQPPQSSEVFNDKVASLRLAIEDLIQTFGERYPDGRQYLKQLQSIEEKGFPAFQREALLANPLVSGQPLLYVVRALDEDGTHTYVEPYRFREYGSALKVIDLSTGRIETIVETAKGIIRSPCVHFDGLRVLFAMSGNREENFNIFEVAVDPAAGCGSVKQLTNASDVSDVDPIYLPDDSIAFASSRDLKYVPCDVQIVPQLFRMSGEGANIHQITRSTAHENQVSVMPDGRILYSRWDYVDRNFADGHGFWVANPDGTNQALIWGNNTTHPSAGWSARSIPGTGRLLCILGVHHDSLGGSLAILDPRAAIEGYESIVRTWPVEVKSRFQHLGDSSLESEEDSELRYALQIWSPVVRHLWNTDPNMQLYRHTDALRNVRPWYNTPWPLSEKYFLCVRAAERDAPPAIYLVDVFGNELMVHQEGAGCFSPMPLAPRSRPVSIPSRRDYGNGDGLFYIQDVYQGTHMKGIEPGTVKAVRVVEVLSKRGLSNGAEWAGLGGQNPGVNWMDFNAKQVLGTAPVEEDGSAYFAVPSDRFVYFQLLDENGMMVQSMRSGTSVHSGEMLACVGCHESRHAASASSDQAPVTLASMRAPSKLDPWFGPPRPFSYQNEIQPVLDKHCVECHDFGKEGERKIVLSGDKTASFNVSYMELWRKGYVGGIGAGPAGTLPPKSWGSHTSKLVKLLHEGHRNLKLDAESMDRLITWIDINGPYYPTTSCAYPNNPPGRCPLEREETETLGELTGFSLEEVIHARRSKGPMLNFDRPELSPCLSSLSKGSRKYRKALALIRKGQERLQKRPRADMPGFVPWERDLRRMAHREKYRRFEMNARQAIREGTSRYEPDQDVYKDIEIGEE
jgi:hypothetical protein